jgi:hypothetical protein
VGGLKRYQLTRPVLRSISSARVSSGWPDRNDVMYKPFASLALPVRWKMSAGSP